jgi:hypothetical protein
VAEFSFGKYVALLLNKRPPGMLKENFNLNLMVLFCFATAKVKLSDN